MALQSYMRNSTPIFLNCNWKSICVMFLLPRISSDQIKNILSCLTHPPLFLFPTPFPCFLHHFHYFDAFERPISSSLLYSLANNFDVRFISFHFLCECSLSNMHGNSFNNRRWSNKIKFTWVVFFLVFVLQFSFRCIIIDLPLPRVHLFSLGFVESPKKPEWNAGEKNGS